MDKVWSFNTTLRNPERMEYMLRALSELEGQDFNATGQKKFFSLQIKKRLYKPEKRTLEENDLIEAVHSNTSADDIDDKIVERIVEKYKDKDVDGSARGRTSAGILNRFGLCVALQSKGSVVITDLAKKWLNKEIDDDELFTKFFLKWQYPNEIEGGYNDFDIKPFIGTLALISIVNSKWQELKNKPVGLSKEEYRLFVPSISNASQIKEYADRIISYRSKRESLYGKEKKDFIKDFEVQRLKEIFPNKNQEKALNDLYDYTDSSIRYFRMSGLIALRGKDTHVDIPKDKEVEVDSILRVISPNAKNFDSHEEYFQYLSDINAVKLPWQNDDDLEKITTKLSEVLGDEAGEQNINKYLEGIEELSVKKRVNQLEESLNQVRIEKLRNLKHDVVALDECIQKLGSITNRNYETLTVRPSLDFEWYASRALMVLNDAIKIYPSYNIGDDGIPTGFRSNASDIECYYATFNMTVEVTLLLGRDQSYAEGQPVKRHLRDFEDKVGSDSTYCLFVAPILHRDTVNTFWEKYEGRKQKIIPLTLLQFIEILKIAKLKIKEGRLNHESLNQLLLSIYNSHEKIDVPQEWLGLFPNLIKKWSV